MHVKRRSTHARPGMHMQLCSAVQSDCCLKPDQTLLASGLHTLNAGFLFAPIWCPWAGALVPLPAASDNCTCTVRVQRRTAKLGYMIEPLGTVGQLCLNQALHPPSYLQLSNAAGILKSVCCGEHLATEFLEFLFYPRELYTGCGKIDNMSASCAHCLQSAVPLPLIVHSRSIRRRSNNRRSLPLRRPICTRNDQVRAAQTAQSGTSLSPTEPPPPTPPAPPQNHHSNACFCPHAYNPHTSTQT